MASKKTAVLGASPNPARYSYLAARMLRKHGHEVLLLGRRRGEVDGEPILTEWPSDEPAHTVTVYMNAGHQQPFYDYILGLSPQRIIFNPGAENEELEQMARQRGIETLNACTLVLLSTGQY